jgi:hypothetical protein
MFESGVGGHFDHNVGSHSDDLDLLAAPVANVAATDERWHGWSSLAATRNGDSVAC